MEQDQLGGVIAIIIGLIFIIAPIFSSDLVSLIIGISFLFFGILVVANGIRARSLNMGVSSIVLILGIIAIIFGILFIFFINAIPFLLSIQFYIIGIIMIFAGLLGLMGPGRMFSILILIMGILMIYFGTVSATNPIFAPILLGVCFIIEGLGLVITR